MKATVVRRIGSMVLAPPLFFPPGTEILGIEVLAHKSRGKTQYDIGYVAVVPTRWEEAERFYQQRYRNEKTRWYSPRTGDPRRVVVIFSRSNGGIKKTVATLLISDGVRGEITKYAGRRQGRWTSVYALVEAEGLRAQLDALAKDPAGRLVTFSIYLPQIE